MSGLGIPVEVYKVGVHSKMIRERLLLLHAVEAHMVISKEVVFVFRK
jgi:hypothetical protein